MNAYRDQYATLFHGGKDIVLLAISADPADTLASWAKDARFPFTFLSDPSGEAGKLYGAWLPDDQLDNRSLFVVTPDGKIGYKATPFREVDPQAYTELGAALTRIAGKQG
ncbi:MAG TPA: redoxin domain-containing protein [Gemmatimonadales bacterium]|jgi:peroxiredoxin|nr:redoxin domain-containing protein [Gemmatimonadales bacterium]